MRQTYIPNKGTFQMYKQFFQTGSGYDPNGYIYTMQNGAGIGGFLRSALNFAMPIGKKMLYKGYEMAKPELKKVGISAVDAATRVIQNKLENSSSKAQKHLNKIGKPKSKKRRRKVDIFE